MLDETGVLFGGHPVVSALHNETRLIEMKPIDAIKHTLVKQRSSQPLRTDEKSNRYWYKGEISL